MKWLLPTLLVVSSKLFAISPSYIEKGFKKASDKTGVPVILIKAICSAESRLKPNEYNHSDGGGSHHAFGLCQVLYTTAKEQGFKDSKCKGDFRNRKKNYKSCGLFGPHTNALYAAKYIAYQLKRYDNSWISAIAAYNSGSVKTCPRRGYFYIKQYSKKKKRKIRYKKKCVSGGLLNQYYVDRVMGYIIKEKANESNNLVQPEKSFNSRLELPRELYNAELHGVESKTTGK